MVLAEDIIVLLSINTTGNMAILATAQSVCEMNSVKYINLAEIGEINLQQVLYSTRAKVVVAIGDKAYKLASSIALKVNVIGVLTTDQKPNTISYLPPPEKYLATMRKLGHKSVVVIYSKKTAAYLHKAAELAGSYGITLIHREAFSPSEAIDQFLSLKSQADSLWILPDSNVLTVASAERLLHLAQESNIPVYVFSDNYLKNGAAVVIEPDREQIGRIVGETVCSVVKNTAPTLQLRDPFREIVNDTILNRLKPLQTSSTN